MRLLRPDHPESENQSDGRTETIHPTFLNPANQMSGTKQWNLDLFVVMLTRLRFQTLNCQAQTVSSFAYLRVCEKEFYAAFFIGSLVGLEIDVLISFGFFIYNRDKFIRLTVFYYKRTATQIIIFTVVVQNRRIIGFDNFFSKKIPL